MEEITSPFKNLRIDTARYQYFGLWEELRVQPPLPPRRCYHSGVLIENRIYIFGGHDINCGVMNDI